MAGKWIVCAERLPKPTPGSVPFKKYRVWLEIRHDLSAMNMRASGESEATRDVLGWFVERHGTIIDLRPTQWYEEALDA